jgi:hypothetical protein
MCATARVPPGSAGHVTQGRVAPHTQVQAGPHTPGRTVHAALFLAAPSTLGPAVREALNTTALAAPQITAPVRALPVREDLAT